MRSLRDDELLIGLTATADRFQKQLAGALSIHGIGFTEYLVLRHLNLAPGNKLRRIDIAEKVGLSASGVTRLLNPMQKIGLVSKEGSPRDARVSLVILTDAGKRTFENSDSSVSDTSKDLLSQLDGKSRKALEHIVLKLS
jgi:DNA-binding MarR family transcriptional regulator